jgi:large subunit ribosomal protein L24
MISMNVKKGDIVVILSGDDKGKSGKILKAMPREQKVIVEGLNTVKKHQKSRRQGQKGQVVDVAMPLHVSKVRKEGESKKSTKTVKTTKSTKKTK